MSVRLSACSKQEKGREGSLRGRKICQNNCFILEQFDVEFEENPFTKKYSKTSQTSYDRQMPVQNRIMLKRGHFGGLRPVQSRIRLQVIHLRVPKLVTIFV